MMLNIKVDLLYLVKILVIIIKILNLEFSMKKKDVNS